VFDHYTFLRDFVNPLFELNQQFIRDFAVTTTNFNDYSLNNEARSIFEKRLFNSQNTKGIFSLIDDTALLNDVKKMGRLLFYDPILSANNSRSCASCHKPTEYFTDTTQATAFQFNHEEKLTRNTPSLVNSVYNHLLMLDGKHISLQDQGKDVMHNPLEMNIAKEDLVKKVMSCKEYRDTFKKLLKHTPEEKEVVMDHIISAITFYYADFSQYQAPFDDAMNKKAEMDASAKKGFNLFMSKAQCATCHFVPMFNGVKPPYIGTEFEVLGVPSDKNYSKLSDDKGRHIINPATETLNAFRTTTLRNSAHTKPYMHNGVFESLEEVIDLYDGGGGIGRKLSVPNQTLSSDSLRLTPMEKSDLISFIKSLDEKIIFETPPQKLPVSSNKVLNARKIGGDY
jgi:cytochrome c peroxidase